MTSAVRIKELGSRKNTALYMITATSIDYLRKLPGSKRHGARSNVVDCAGVTDRIEVKD